MDDDSFDLPVKHNGTTLLLKASLLVTGYTHKFIVEVNGYPVAFEPDEETNYRAVINPADMENIKMMLDIELLRNIAATIDQIVK